MTQQVMIVIGDPDNAFSDYAVDIAIGANLNEQILFPDLLLSTGDSKVQHYIYTFPIHCFKNKRCYCR